MVKCSKRRHARTIIFVIVSTLIVLSGGCMTLLWQVNHTQNSHADGSSVLGPPTLPAATVNSILAQMGSPMVGTGDAVEQAAQKYNIDDAFALGVWWTETNDGAAGVGLADRNPGSVRGTAGYPSAYDGYTIYPSYTAAIWDWFSLIRSRYVDGSGLTSVYTICYPYVGTSGASTWAAKVMNLMIQYRSEAPAPIPTPKPATPTPKHASLQPISVHQATTAVVKPTVSGKVVSNSQVQATSATTTQQKGAQSQDILTLSGKALPIGFAVFAIAGLVFLNMKKRRSRRVAPVPAVNLDWQPGKQIAANPPLYVNQYSPVLDQQPLYASELLTTEPLVFPGVEQLSFAEEKIPTPVGIQDMDTSELIVAQPAPSPLSRMAARKRITLLPAANNETEEEFRSSTEQLPPLRSISLPGRVREPVGVKGGGLLRRYGS